MPRYSSTRKTAARKARRKTASRSTGKSGRFSITQARKLIAFIERSQIPFGSSAPMFASIKEQVDAGKKLSREDHQHLMDLVNKAKGWERDVESSAITAPEETLPGD